MALKFKEYDSTAKAWLDKHEMTDKEIKELAENTGKDTHLVLEREKMSYAQSKKEHKDLESELMERTMLGTASADEVAGNIAYNAGVPLPIAQSVNQGLSNLKIDALGSDAQIVEYYKNYDKHKEEEKAAMTQSYETARKREQSLENSEARLAISKKALEDNYEAQRISAEHSNRSEKLGNTISELGDLSGNIVDDVFDFLT